jgi:hypothetical protein
MSKLICLKLNGKTFKKSSGLTQGILLNKGEKYTNSGVYRVYLVIPFDFNY